MIHGQKTIKFQTDDT